MKANDFGTFLKFCRTACIITQTQLGEVVGTNKHSVSAWELGKYLPSTEKYRELIQYFSSMEDKCSIPLPLKELQAAYVQERANLWGERGGKDEPDSRGEDE